MKVYFSGEFSSRRPITIAISVVMTTVGSFFVIMWVPQMELATIGQNPVGMLGGIVLCLGWLGFGVFLLRQVIKNKKSKFEITSEGISLGALKCSWGDITEIGSMRKYWRRTDLYCMKRSNSGETEMMLELLDERGLTSLQIKNLLAALEKEIVPQHPHLLVVRAE